MKTDVKHMLVSEHSICLLLYMDGQYLILTAYCVFRGKQRIWEECYNYIKFFKSPSECLVHVQVLLDQKAKTFCLLLYYLIKVPQEEIYARTINTGKYMVRNLITILSLGGHLLKS